MFWAVFEAQGMCGFVQVVGVFDAHKRHQLYQTADYQLLTVFTRTTEMLGLFATKKILTQNKRAVCTIFSCRIKATNL